MNMNTQSHVSLANKTKRLLHFHGRIKWRSLKGSFISYRYVQLRRIYIVKFWTRTRLVTCRTTRYPTQKGSGVKLYPWLPLHDGWGLTGVGVSSCLLEHQACIKEIDCTSGIAMIPFKQACPIACSSLVATTSYQTTRTVSQRYWSTRLDMPMDGST